MSQTNQSPKPAKRRFALRIIGLALLFVGIGLMLALLFAGKANSVSVIICNALVLFGLILTASPEAWLNVITGALWGGL